MSVPTPTRHLPVALAFLMLLCGSIYTQERDVTFIHISDSQYDATEQTKFPASRKAARAMNQIAGTPYPNAIGGRVGQPRGVIMSGDLTSNGTPEEFRIFKKYWGLTGSEGVLDLPMFDSAGNHDPGVSTGDGYVRKQIIKRNKKRPIPVTTSKNGLHYSWDWDDVHFINLNEYAGRENTEPYPEISEGLRKVQSYGTPAEKSLQFLRKDLKHNVGNSNRPVVIVQHYGFDDFAFRPWGEDAAWWTEAQALRLWDAIEGYNVVAILGGHNGGESRFDWHGIPTQHMDDRVRFGVFRLTDTNISMAQYNSDTGDWEKHWSRPIPVNTSEPPQLVQGPYLIPNGDPDAMTICWRTNKNVSTTLEWGDVHFRYEDGSAEVTPYDRQHHLYKHTIDNLKQGTGINFVLKIKDRYAPGMFHTTENDQESVHFLIADTPNRMRARNPYFRVMYDFIYRAPAYDSFVLHPNGFVNRPKTIEAWDRHLFSRKRAGRHVRYLLRRAPILAPTGDTGPERTLFPYDYTEAGSYTVERGPLTVAVLNAKAGLSPDGLQARWLIHVLKNASTDWQTVVWEKTGNPQTDRPFKQHLQRICNEHSVELVVAGGEQYSRDRVEGTTHLTTGTRPEAETPGMINAVKIDGDTMTVYNITPDAKREKQFQRTAN